MGFALLFLIVLGSGGRVAFRWPLDAHFELFWSLVDTWFPRRTLDTFSVVFGLEAEWLPDGLWRFVLCCFEVLWQNGFPDGFGLAF